MNALRADFANRVLALAAAALLLAMPVTARAGMRDPHPHALLQIVLDRLDGALDHHAPASGEPSRAAHVHRGRHVDPFSLAPDMGHAAAAAAAVAAASSDRGARRGPDAPAARDTPAWSAAAASASLIWTFLPVLAAAWVADALRDRSARRPRAVAIPPRDRFPRPELPPPRPLTGLASG